MSKVKSDSLEVRWVRWVARKRVSPGWFWAFLASAGVFALLAIFMEPGTGELLLLAALCIALAVLSLERAGFTRILGETDRPEDNESTPTEDR